MKHIDIKNLHYEKDGKITADVLFEGNSEYWPFTASLDDNYEHTKTIFKECEEGKWGPIAPYTEAQ